MCVYQYIVEFVIVRENSFCCYKLEYLLYILHLFVFIDTFVIATAATVVS